MGGAESFPQVPSVRWTVSKVKLRRPLLRERGDDVRPPDLDWNGRAFRAQLRGEREPPFTARCCAVTLAILLRLAASSAFSCASIALAIIFVLCLVADQLVGRR